MKHILHLFTLYLGAGVLLLLPLLDHRRLQDSFFRLVSGIALPALLIAWLARPQSGVVRGFEGSAALEPVSLLLLGLTVAYVTLVWAGRPAWGGYLAWPLSLVALATLVLEAVAHTALGPGVAQTVALIAALLTSAATLGTVLVAMSLGHWYLMSPGLPVSHLRKLTLAMAVAVGGSLLVFLASAGGLIQTSTGLGVDPATWLISNMPFLAMRLIMGIVIPGILAWRIDQFVRVRSTQKATGLLYVALIFVLFGELMSAYLLVLTAMPT